MTNESNKKYGRRQGVQKRNTTGQGIMSQRKAKEKEEQYGVFDNDDQGTEKHCTDCT